MSYAGKLQQVKTWASRLASSQYKVGPAPRGPRVTDDGSSFEGTGAGQVRGRL